MATTAEHSHQDTVKIPLLTHNSYEPLTSGNIDVVPDCVEGAHDHADEGSIAGDGAPQENDDELEENTIVEIELTPQELEARYRQRRGAATITRVFASLYLWIMLPIGLCTTLIVQITFWITLWPLFLCRPNLRCWLMGLTFRTVQTLVAFVFNPFWWVKVVRRPLNPDFVPGGDCLFVCNHLSAADPWVFNAAFYPWELKWVYKADLRKIPIAGQVFRLSGDHPLFFTPDKGGWGTVPGGVQKLMDRVLMMGRKHNIGTVVFPEGTRSKSGRLQPFKNGFFRFAIENDFRIVPCVANNSPSLWPLGSMMFGAGTAYVAIGDPIQHRQGESVDELKRRVRKTMISMIKVMPLYHPELDAPLEESMAVVTRGGGWTGTKK